MLGPSGIFPGWLSLVYYHFVKQDIRHNSFIGQEFNNLWLEILATLYSHLRVSLLRCRVSRCHPRSTASRISTGWAPISVVFKSPWGIVLPVSTRSPTRCPGEVASSCSPLPRGRSWWSGFDPGSATALPHHLWHKPLPGSIFLCKRINTLGCHEDQIRHEAL